MRAADRTRQREADTPQTVVRCAIYTRKSTDEGLEQEFNSLDAQRESAEAYIASQRSEGWTCLAERYDDGGFSGGNTERPALKRLLTDVQAGRIDCVVTYKVDRLSRSLMDFTKIMEILDRHQVSFVSVTQQFNTTSSMGRLTLNILLSFAQFEREIIAERTLDKMSAARKKGKWVGGVPILGYDIAPGGGRLLVNPEEAARVRTMFDIYLREESLLDTARELNARGWTLKLWTNQKGQKRGGGSFNKNNVFRLLTNMVYIGKVNYKGGVYEGEHEAIVDEAQWRRVQDILRRNGQTGGVKVRNKYGALLKGILYCVPCNAAMVHAMTAKKGCRRYRYYVCSSAQKRGWDTCPSKSVPAIEAEDFVVHQIMRLATDEKLLAAVVEQAAKQSHARRTELQIDLHETQTRLRADLELIAALAIDTPGYLELRERIGGLEKRVTALKSDIAAVDRSSLSLAEAAMALDGFTSLWEALKPKERVRVVHLLVERIGYDGRKGSLSITFRPCGIEALEKFKRERT